MISVGINHAFLRFSPSIGEGSQNLLPLSRPMNAARDYGCVSVEEETFFLFSFEFCLQLFEVLSEEEAFFSEDFDPRGQFQEFFFLQLLLVDGPVLFLGDLEFMAHGVHQLGVDLQEVEFFFTLDVLLCLFRFLDLLFDGFVVFPQLGLEGLVAFLLLLQQ